MRIGKIVSTGFISAFLFLQATPFNSLAFEPPLTVEQLRARLAEARAQQEQIRRVAERLDANESIARLHITRNGVPTSNGTGFLVGCSPSADPAHPNSQACFLVTASHLFGAQDATGRMVLDRYGRITVDNPASFGVTADFFRDNEMITREGLTVQMFPWVNPVVIPDRDLALGVIYIPNSANLNIPSIPVNTSQTLPVGTHVIGVGCRGDGPPTLYTGPNACVNRIEQGGCIVTNQIPYPGDSGGPLYTYDENGRLVVSGVCQGRNLPREATGTFASLQYLPELLRQNQLQNAALRAQGVVIRDGRVITTQKPCISPTPTRSR